MLQAVFTVARHRARRTAGIRTAFLPQTYTENTRNIQWRRHNTNSRGLSEKQYILTTLDPSDSSAAPQEELDVSGKTEIILSCRGRSDTPVRMRYSVDGDFPPNTRGVLHYVPAKRHIRFRLCDSVVDFRRGSDLLKSNGERWILSLENMASRVSQYRPLLDMITEEHPSSAADIDGMLSKRRIITTLSPQDLVAKGQRVFDISNLTAFNPQFYTSSVPNVKRCYISYYFGRDYAPFPADTKGVFYYKQSTTVPNTIGELRFRLCLDVASFDMGRDLCLPSGLPWCIASNNVLSMPYYSAIRKQLLHEGLLEKPLPLYADASSIPIICNLNQPFVVDLSHNRLRLRFRIGAEIGKEIPLSLFGTESTSFYTGRAVVQFERYPSEFLRGRRLKRNPLFALRFMEFLTAVEARPDLGLSPLHPPEVGHLLLRRSRGGHFLPWGYSPQDATHYEQLLKLTEQTYAQ